jgi:zinc transport system substrate-binding protein
VGAIFYDTIANPRVVNTLAADLGINAAVLNTLEGLTNRELAAGEDYFTIMRANLATLITYLQ